MEGTNRFRNWVADTNRFNLEAPPDWFLVELHNFDAALVVIPSRFTRRYLLARKRQYTAGLGDVAMLDNRHPDTNMLYTHNLLPVSHLNFTGTWATKTLFEQLRRRDTWAVTGGPTSMLRDAGEKLEALANAVDDADRAVEAKRKRILREDFYHRGRDAWRSLQARIGTRNKRASDAHGVAPAPKPKPQTTQRVILTDASSG